MNELIYGKNALERIVSIEPGDSEAVVYRELADGTVVSETVPNTHYLLFHEKLNDKFVQLKGNQFYRYAVSYNTRARYEEVLKGCYQNKHQIHVIRDAKEALMCKDGLTYYKGMKPSDVSVLSFDIETNGLNENDDSRVLLISNTFRRGGVVTRKLFCVDDYPGQEYMLRAWCNWVQEMNPSVLTGHNIFGFDLPYLAHCFELTGERLFLGRDGSNLRFNTRVSQFRKDGSQSYDYTNALIYGREVVDTMFLAMKYDVAARREYDSYGLKAVVKHEGLERKGRVFVDAGKIKDIYANRAADPKAWNDVKKYAVDDGDDALKLYDLMIPSYFYLAQSVPRSFQQLINTATGSHVNSLMVRGYLQQGHSIALGSEKADFQGAISFGVPGVHKNVFKIDVQSLYPSIILSHRLCNRAKDPQELFLQMVDFFTQERIANKEKAEATGDRHYKDLSDSQKIAINSMYGFLGAPKLNYNSPADAAKVTEIGREILKTAIKWASGSDYVSPLEEGAYA